jgi:hypothetical protein
MSEIAFIRRVRHPNPVLEELARQAVDELETQAYLKDDSSGSFVRIADLAHRYGVPFEYVLDERERRVRALARRQG